MKRKVCVLGAFATGKTSLVRRLVHGTFTDAYYTTIGVRIDKLALAVEGEPVELVLWDLHGEDRFQTLEPTYLRGAAGIVLVADVTRPSTLEAGLELERRALAAVGEVPLVWALNKTDVGPAEGALTRLSSPVGAERQVRLTSARTGEGVEDAFGALARAVVAGGARRVG